MKEANNLLPTTIAAQESELFQIWQDKLSFMEEESSKLCEAKSFFHQKIQSMEATIYLVMSPLPSPLKPSKCPCTGDEGTHNTNEVARAYCELQLEEIDKRKRSITRTDTNTTYSII